MESRFHILKTLSETNKLVKCNLDIRAPALHFFKFHINGNWYSVHINLYYYIDYMNTNLQYVHFTVINGLQDKSCFLNQDEKDYFF